MAEDTKDRELARLRSVTRLHQSIGASLDFEHVCRKAVRELIGLTGCDGCAILRVEGDRVDVVAEKGFRMTFGDFELTTDMPAIRHILDQEASIFTGDLPNSPAASCVPRGCAMQSLLCVPIIVSDRVQGILHLDSHRTNAFDREDLQFVEFLACELSIAFERSLAYSAVADRAIRDGLTGCLNRRKFDLDLTAEVAAAQATAAPVALLLLDIDFFKSYNDAHGHPAGDGLLTTLGGLLAECVRPGDGVYRYGGEEFALLLPGAARQDGERVAERVRRTVAQEEFEGEQQSQPGGKVTVSIGVAEFPSDGGDADGIRACADSALYRAKSSGRNTVCIADGHSSSP